jgi:hypothetical protein
MRDGTDLKKLPKSVLTHRVRPNCGSSLQFTLRGPRDIIPAHKNHHSSILVNKWHLLPNKFNMFRPSSQLYMSTPNHVKLITDVRKHNITSPCCNICALFNGIHSLKNRLES